MWTITPSESFFYVEDNFKNTMFRDAVLSFFSSPSSKKDSPEDKYCKACRQLNKNVDCDSCSKKFEVTENGRK